MRLVTYNIRGGLGMDGRRSIERIAEVLRPLEADVICLQEVNKRLPWSGFEDQPARLSKLLGMRAVFQNNYRVGIGGFGNAILTQLPIEGRLDEKLPNPRERASILRRTEGRGVLGVTVEVEGRPLLVLCTHWSLDSTDRLEALPVLERALRKHAGSVVLAGDLNAFEDSEEVNSLRTRLGLVDSGASAQALTFPSVEPASRIDYIWHSATVESESVRVIDSPASDHLPMVCDLQIRR